MSGYLCWTRLVRAEKRRAGTSTSTSSRGYSKKTGHGGGRERMRVAVVGGGVSGLATALHLAPLASQGLISSPIDVYEGNSKRGARSIGVGIWSTALEKFRTSTRPSHRLVWERMTNQGSWVGDVGYRTPQGSWLVNSHLPTTIPDEENDMPGLLFLKESAVQSALATAVAAEQNNSTVQLHSNARVAGIFEESPHPWSAPLLLNNGRATERDYHLIVAADGMGSELRKSYGGHYSPRNERRLTGASAFPSTSKSLLDPEKEKRKSTWDAEHQSEIIHLEDRKYTVYRANAPIVPGTEGQPNFQTWGEGKSMRFATVRMEHPCSTKDNNNHQRGAHTEEKQVWFITLDDDKVNNEPDPQKRKELLLETFGDWHDPICEIVNSTPATEILAERAMAHAHCVGPVNDMNEVLKRIRGKRPPSSGRGPAMVFIGDAFMAVDPILAQGFSVGLEAAADLPTSIEASCGFRHDDGLLFDPYRLREELQERHERRLDRLVALLRATEIVQALGQPRDGTITGLLAKKVLRPAMAMAPNFVKAPVFDAVLRYSLGLPLSASGKNR